jgi:AbiV family abortive infection protein
VNPEDKHKQLILTREICLANAEACLSVAEREIGRGVDHVCFHLALLALEEIGKSILATIQYTVATGASPKEDLDVAMDDHIKKMFWALWGGSMLRNEKFSKEDIERNRYLATSLHERRLESLYTDAKNPLPIGERIEEKEARMITELARARLEMEKAQGITEFESGDIEDLTWFFKAMEDPDKRKEIFSSKSLAKLTEVKNGKEWVKWLRDIYRKHEEEMREYAQKEMRRKKPEGEDAHTPKYRMRIRIQTPSHSIRNNAFAEWNKGIHGIKIYKSDRKDATKLTKGEMCIDLTLPKGLHTSYVWEHGLFMAKTVVLSFNVATLGVFWWNVQKDISTYYVDIVDLEADPNGGVKLVVAPHKRLHVGFDEAHLVLDQNTVRNVFHVLTLFMRESKKLEEFLRAYATGLTIFSKIDIHLQIEANAFDEFYKALKAAMIAFGDWDGTGDFKSAVKNQFEKIGDMKDLDKTLDLGSNLEADAGRTKHHPITLTEVIAMKIYCDFYMQLKAKEYLENLKQEEGDDTEKPPKPFEGEIGAE